MKKSLINIFKVIIAILIIVFSMNKIVYSLELEESQSPNITDTVGDLLEAIYKHQGKVIYREGEEGANATVYLTDEQMSIVNTAIHQCSVSNFKTCSNHASYWAQINSWGILDLSIYANNDSGRIQAQNFLSSYVSTVMNGDGNCNIKFLVSYLNNPSKSGVEVLEKFSSVFCLKHHWPLPKYKGVLKSDHRSDYPVWSWITTNYDSNPYGGGNASISKGDTSDYLERSTENNTTRISRSNTQYFAGDYQDLYTINNGFGTYSTNVFAYALSFSQKLNYLNGNYAQERTQNSIWNVVGDVRTGDIVYDDDYVMDSNPTSGQNLYNSGKALDEYESYFGHGASDSHTMLSPKVSVKGVGLGGEPLHGVNVGTVNEATGTTLQNNNTTYKIGPFTMSDYAYAYAECTEGYSGQNLLKYKGLLGGIVDGKIYLDNGKEITIGNSGQAKIVYTDMNGTPTNRGDNNRSGTYFTAPANYEYPWPNSTFYIEVPRSVCGDATTLSQVSFEYRRTKAEGKGWVITSKYVEIIWKRSDKGQSSCSYKCQSPATGCSGGESPSPTSNPFINGTCTHGWYSGCTNYTCDAEDCSGHHRHGTWNTSTHTTTYLCTHKHKECRNTEWMPGQPQVLKGQPLLAVNKSEVTVNTKTHISPLNVRLTTDISIDKYISEVKHATGTVTYSDIERANKKDAEKNANPVYVEYGDTVTYTINIKNKQSQEVMLRIRDILPELSELLKDETNLTVSYNGTETNNRLAIYTNNDPITVSGNKTLTLIVKIVVDSVEGKYENESKIITRNGITKNANYISSDNVNYIRSKYSSGDKRNTGPVVNIAELDENGGTTNLQSSDWYKLNNYKLTMDKYISEYNAEMMLQNNQSGFTNEHYEKQDTKAKESKNSEGKFCYDLNYRYAEDEKYKEDHPVIVEKTETFVYSLRLTNDSKEDEEFEGSDVKSGLTSGKKHATQVRPTTITDTMDVGLQIVEKNGYKVKAIIYKANGTVKEEIPYSSIKIDKKGNAETGYTYTFNIVNELGKYILDPGEYLIYYLTTEVTKSNMYLLKLQNYATITTATDINNITKSDENTREIQKPDDLSKKGYNRNKAQQQKSSDYVRMNDLVIAGKVWLDEDKNGEMNDNEYKFESIKVHLYNVRTGKYIRTTKTDTNGLYTFSKDANGGWIDETKYNESILGNQRVNKATNKDANGNYSQSSVLEQYYIEFEYDGLMYKSTEVYGGNQEKDPKDYYGMGNLESEGAEKWLPSSGPKYMKDSNAYEFHDTRINYNKKFETISNNDGRITNKGTALGNTNGIELEYDKKDNVSKLVEADRQNLGERRMTARSFILKGSNTSLSNTKTLWLYKQETKYDLPETEYLKYINLGLEEREEVDLSLTKDVYEIKTTINGEEVIYTYDRLGQVVGNKYTRTENDRYTGRNSLGVTGSISSVTGSVLTRYGRANKIFETSTDNPDSNSEYIIANPYELKIYESDYYYRKEQYINKEVQDYKGTESELNVEITYKMVVTSEEIKTDEPSITPEKDIKVESAINEIIDYYDENFIKGTAKEILIKETKEEAGYLYGKLVNKSIKVAEAWYYESDEKRAKDERTYLKIEDDSKYQNGSHGHKALKDYNISYIRSEKGEIFRLNEGESKEIYVKYVLDKENGSRDLKIDSKHELGIENVGEIGAYSTYYNNGEEAGLVDRDSNPGNIGTFANDAESYKKYAEDDTCKTAIDIKVETPNIPGEEPGDPDNPYEPEGNENKPLRILSGHVWDDARSEKESERTEIQYIGDGISGEGSNNGSAKMNTNVDTLVGKEKAEKEDIRVKNAKAEIVEIVEVNGKYYEEVLSPTWLHEYETRTSENGIYRLYGFIPGYYIVKFSYGDIAAEEMLVFNGQDYKSTQYTTVELDANGNPTNKMMEEVTAFESKEARIEHYDKVIKALEYPNKNTARDDEVARLGSIAYSETMVNGIAEVLKAQNTYYEYNVGKAEGYEASQITEYQEELIDNTKMNAETITFHVKPEKLKDETIKTSYEKTYNTFEDMLYNDIETRPYSIKNIDFGMEYRPEAQISLNKVINFIEIVTSNNETLAKVVLDTKVITDSVTGEETSVHIVNESESIGLENVQFLTNEYDSKIAGYEIYNEKLQGFVYINIEEEILQGSTIKIEYGFTATNESEIDRINENLDAIRYKENPDTNSYTKKEYTELGMYTAAGTARAKLDEEYNKRSAEDNKVIYRKKPKVFEDTLISEGNEGYFGRYLGNIYYNGEIGEHDVIGQIKFDKILDYIDNNLVFEGVKNSSENRLWTTTTSIELMKNKLIKGAVFKLVSGLEKLVDSKEIQYDTNNRSNLVISVDDRIKDGQQEKDIVNNLLSKYLLPKTMFTEENQKIEENIKSYSGSIDLVTTKLISQETLTEDMNYENVAEVIQFSTTTGRRTNFATTIGNAEISSGEFKSAKKESDTSATEQITLTPPTGFERNKIQNAIRSTINAIEDNIGIIIIAIIGIAVVLIGIITTKFIIERIKKRPIK